MLCLICPPDARRSLHNAGFHSFTQCLRKVCATTDIFFIICPARARRRRTWGDHTEADPLISYMVQNVKDFQGLVLTFEAFERPFQGSASRFN